MKRQGHLSKKLDYLHRGLRNLHRQAATLETFASMKQGLSHLVGFKGRKVLGKIRRWISKTEPIIYRKKIVI